MSNDINDWFSYEPETGIIRWARDRTGDIKENTVAGSVTKEGYRRIGFNGKTYAAHRLAWYLYYGVWPECDLDHKDSRRDNNAITNLREANDHQNNQNALPRKNGTSLYKGVSWDSAAEQWRARISLLNSTIYLGRYFSEKDAALAYNEAAKKHFGDYAKLNVISTEAQLVGA